MTQILSPLRAVLCSRANALRIARRLHDCGVATVVIATSDPLQPWRVSETDEASHLEGRACA